MEKIELTAREKEVGICLLAGMTAKQIAKKLNISFYTVEGYQRILKEKLKSKTPWQSGYLLAKLLAEDSSQNNNQVEADFDNQSRIVTEKAKGAGLDQPMQPKLAGTVNQTLEQGKSRINQGKTQFSNERSTGFTKHQETQKGITQDIMD